MVQGDTPCPSPALLFFFALDELCSGRHEKGEGACKMGAVRPPIYRLWSGWGVLKPRLQLGCDSLFHVDATIEAAVLAACCVTLGSSPGSVRL